MMINGTTFQNNVIHYYVKLLNDYKSYTVYKSY